MYTTHTSTFTHLQYIHIHHRHTHPFTYIHIHYKHTHIHIYIHICVCTIYTLMFTHIHIHTHLCTLPHHLMRQRKKTQLLFSLTPHFLCQTKREVLKLKNWICFKCSSNYKLRSILVRLGEKWLHQMDQDSLFLCSSQQLPSSHGWADLLGTQPGINQAAQVHLIL